MRLDANIWMAVDDNGTTRKATTPSIAYERHNLSDRAPRLLAPACATPIHATQAVRFL